MSRDLFADKSKSWDMNSKRVGNARAIAKTIQKNIELKPTMKLMDFGAGTGLLSYFVAPLVERIVMVDNSPSMLDKFKEKASEFECQTEIREIDLSKTTLDEKFDGIISSMTIHHIEDQKALFTKFYNMLDEGGFIAIADLDSEDGSFHSDNTGVFHFGFDREILKQIAKEVGFKNINFELASTISKPHCKFTIFLMIAKR